MIMCYVPHLHNKLGNKDEYYIILSIKELSFVGQTHDYVTNNQKCHVTSSKEYYFFFLGRMGKSKMRDRLHRGVAILDLGVERAFQIQRTAQRTQCVQEIRKSFMWLQTIWVRKEESGNSDWDQIMKDLRCQAEEIGPHLLREWGPIKDL